MMTMLVSVILWPTLYVFGARPGDHLPPAEQSLMAEREHVDKNVAPGASSGASREATSVRRQSLDV